MRLRAKVWLRYKRSLLVVGGRRAPEPLELPVVGSTRGYREWAVRVGTNAGYRRPATPVWTARLDSIFLNRTWGPIIFGVVVIGVFQTIFALGQPLSNLLQHFLDSTGASIGNHLPAGMFQSLLINGVWKGTGSVLVFLPQILLLFLVIGVLEDSGYLSRAAVIADRTMSRVGLNGKSFIPLLSAYACAVPAIMATRTIESKRDRMATILIAPFMTCSARLPVYTMVIAAFLPNHPVLGVFLGTRALAMLGLYVLGFLMAVMTAARLLKSTILKSKLMLPSILEMPPYRAGPRILAGTALGRPRQSVSVSRRYRDHAGFAAALGGNEFPHASRATACRAGQRRWPKDWTRD